MNSRIAATLVAMATWFSLHLVVAIVTIDSAHSPVVTLATLGCGAILVAQAARPILPPSWLPQWPAEVAVLALAPSALEWITLTNIEAEAITSYANWPIGVSGLVIAGLVARNRIDAAVTSMVLIITVQTVLYRLIAGPQHFDPLAALFLAVPPEMWLLVSIGVSRRLNTADRLTLRYRGRAAKEAVVTETELAWRNVRAQRLAELETNVLPLLQRAQSMEPAQLEQVRSDAADLCAVVRDSLRGRALMDPTLVASVSDARSRGISVQLSAHLHGAASPGLLAGVRAFLVEMLALPDLRSLRVHVSTDPIELMVLLQLPPTQDQAVWLGLRGSLGDWLVTPTRVDHELILRGRHVGGDAAVGSGESAGV